MKIKNNKILIKEDCENIMSVFLNSFPQKKGKGYDYTLDSGVLFVELLHKHDLITIHTRASVYNILITSPISCKLLNNEEVSSIIKEYVEVLNKGEK